MSLKKITQILLKIPPLMTTEENRGLSFQTYVNISLFTKFASIIPPRIIIIKLALNYLTLRMCIQ